MTDAAINYSALGAERSTILQEQFEKRLSTRIRDESGSTLRSEILSNVVSGNYEYAQKRIQDYVIEKEDFPSFKPRIEKYVDHSFSLIKAIDMKRNFEGLSALSVSKQQELFEKVIEHFDELKQVLLRIETTGHEVKLNDIRSTVIFLRTLVYSTGAIVITALLLDLNNGFLSSYEQVMSHVSTDIINFVFDFFGM